MIAGRNLGRTYRLGAARIAALDGVDLTVEDGEFLAVMGRSGSGKSTLLNLLGLLDRPTTGTLALGGREVTTLSSRERARLRGAEIGVVFQSFHLLGDERAIDNVALPLLYAGRPRRERRRRAGEALERVGLGGRLDHRPAELSGGERQRVAIARAIVKGPSLLLADEPTGNLDSETGAAILDLLAGLHREGRTLIVITHDPEIARRADRLRTLADGRWA